METKLQATWPEPCRKGLTKECFEQYPKWAKQMFAQRLLRCILPKWLTRKLEKLHPELLEPPIPPTSPEVPPPITVTPTPTIEPTPGVDAEPTPGVDAEPTPIAPEAPTPTIEPTPGVIAEPTPGVIAEPTPAPVFGIGVDIPEPPTGGPIPPLYVGVFDGWPIRRGPRGLKRKVSAWFYDDFDCLTDKNWDNDSYGSGSAKIIGGKLQLKATSDASAAIINRTDPQGGILDFDLSFEQEYVTYIDESYVLFYSGSHYLQIIFRPPSDILIYPDVTGEERPVGNYIGTVDIWRLEVRSGLVSVYRNNVLKVTNRALTATTNLPGKMELLSSDNQTILIDDLTIIEK